MSYRMLTARRDEFRHRAHFGVPQIALTALHSLTVTFLPLWLMQVQRIKGPVASRMMPYDFFLTYHHPGVEVPLGRGFPLLVVVQDSLAAVARPAGPRPGRRTGCLCCNIRTGLSLTSWRRLPKPSPVLRRSMSPTPTKPRWPRR